MVGSVGNCSLPRRETAIDYVGLACAIARSIGQQEQHHSDKFFAVGHAAHRGAMSIGRGENWVVVVVYAAWRQAIYADAVPGPPRGEPACQADNAGLAG